MCGNRPGMQSLPGYVAGQHVTSWQGSNVPAGLYFLKIEAVGQVKTQKMVMIK